MFSLGPATHAVAKGFGLDIDAIGAAWAPHVVDAHDQIKKYQRTMKGNRALIIKIFGVLAFIIVIYGTIGS